MTNKQYRNKRKKLEKQTGYKRETMSNEVGMAPNCRGRCARKGCRWGWKRAGKGAVMRQTTVTCGCCLARQGKSTWERMKCRMGKRLPETCRLEGGGWFSLFPQSSFDSM